VSVPRYSLDNTMNNIYPLKQQSKLDISTTSLLTHNENPVEQIDLKENLEQDVLLLMAEAEKLKSTIRILH